MGKTSRSLISFFQKWKLKEYFTTTSFSKTGHFTSITTVHKRDARSTRCHRTVNVFLNTAFNQIIDQFLVTFPVKITASLDSRILNWVVYITLLKLSGLNSSFFIYHNCKLARLSLSKMSSLWKGKLPWSKWKMKIRWKIREKTTGKTRPHRYSHHAFMRKKKYESVHLPFKVEFLRWWSNFLANLKRERRTEGAKW